MVTKGGSYMDGRFTVEIKLRVSLPDGKKSFVSLLDSMKQSTNVIFNLFLELRGILIELPKLLPEIFRTVFINRL